MTGMTRRAWTGGLGVALAWVLWAHTEQSLDNRTSPGTWTRVLATDNEAVCEHKKREQVLSLLNALAKFGATVDPAGETVFYATRTADGRPVMKRTRYRCLPASQNPRRDPP